MGKKFTVPQDNNILKISLDEAMSENYLPYAVEVAKDRALPDVRDGLKPVHRRILYGAHQLKAYPDRPYLKSARIVGDILGKYHPHGDSSVYDAMVILAQDFSTREQLIDGHGNWGSVDGDSAAAMRYTEARLSKISMEMLKDVDKGVVPMVENYSNSEMEPEVLPARFPNLLVNGCFGIAVGLSTNIPPHNIGEVIDGVVALSKKEDITTGELMEYIKGPDLPTGGILMGADSIKSAYESGKGKVTLRAKTEIEKLESGRYGIVITEFPYRKNKARLLHTISEMTGDKRHAKMLEGITDIRDESDRHGIRSVIEFKKSADMKYMEKTLKYLYKKTDLQCNISFNMVSLVNGKPELLGLKSMLEYYLQHQKDVITRRTKKSLEDALKRFHIVEGLIKAIGILDEVIKTIRESKSKKDAGHNLIEKFGFTEEQTIAILEMMLYKLTGLEIITFEKEHKQLKKAIDRYNKILNSENELLKVFRKEILEIKETFNNDRRTEIVQSVEDAKIDREELIIVEDIMVTLSNEGYIKRIPTKSFNRTNGDVNDIEYREGDYNTHLIKSNTRDSIMIFCDDGYVYRVMGSDIPEKKWKDKGEKIDVLIKGFKSDKSRIIGVSSIHQFKEDKAVAFFSKDGAYRKVILSELKSNYTKISCVNLKKEDKLVKVEIMDSSREETFLRIKTQRGLEYILEEPKVEMASRGATMISLLPVIVGDTIIDVNFAEEYSYETFPFSINKRGEMYKEWKRTEFRVYTESNGYILMQFEKGVFINIPAFMMQSIEAGMSLETLIPNKGDFGELISIEAVSKFDMDKEIIIPTENGLIKRCKIEEFIAQGYQESNTKILPGDKMLKTISLDKDSEGAILLVTQKGRIIKFTNESLSTIGKTAKGVLSISLKEEDKVLYSKYVKSDEEKIILRFNNGENEEIDISTIPMKSRGTVGVKISSANDNGGVKSVTAL